MESFNEFPPAFALRMLEQLGDSYIDFKNSHFTKGRTSVRFNPYKQNELDGEPIPWCPSGIYLNERPKFNLDPFFHAGVYYVQEASSMLLDKFLVAL